MSLNNKTAIFLTLMLGAVSISGCGNDDVTITDPALNLSYAGPATEEELIGHFEVCYRNLDADGLMKIIAPDFQFLAHAQTVVQFPDFGPIVDRDLEERVANRMLSGLPVVAPEGHTEPAVRSVEFQVFELLGSWEDAPPGPQFAGARRGMYEVVVEVDRGQENSSFSIRGQIRFYATVRDSVHLGKTYPFWQLVGQQDFTDAGKQGVEGTTFSTAKALYR